VTLDPNLNPDTFTDMEFEADVLVIGAGVSGLAAAGEFARQGRKVVVLDRARGVGGRCATKTLHGQRVDYGVPFLHGTHPHFLGVVESCSTADPSCRLLPGWPHTVDQPRLACQPAAFSSDQRRLAIQEGVSAFPKFLARSLDVRTEVTISLLHAMPGTIEAQATDGRRFRAPRVILALAAPQALRLLEPLSARLEAADREWINHLSAIQPVPCLTVVAGYNPDSAEPPFEAAYPIDTTILHSLVHDSAKRDSPDWRVLVLQARPRYSTQQLEIGEADWTADLVWEAGEVLGSWATRPEWTWPHRWRWARLPAGSGPVAQPAWLQVDGGGELGLCGETFSDSGGVEGAFLSGVSLARSTEFQ